MVSLGVCVETVWIVAHATHEEFCLVLLDYFSPFASVFPAKTRYDIRCISPLLHYPGGIRYPSCKWLYSIP